MIGGRKFRTEEARRKEKRRMIVLAVASVVALVAGGMLAMRTLQADTLRIQKVSIQTDGALSEDELHATLATVLSESHLFVIPNNSWLFTNRSAIIDTLTQSFPRIETIDLRRVNVKDLSVRITERRPDALWCGDVVPTIVRKSATVQEQAANEAWGTCFLMDKYAYIYDHAPLYTGNIYTRYYGPLEHAEPVGQPLVPAHEFAAWQTLAATMREGEHVPVAILFTDEHDVEVYLRGGVRVLMPRTELERAYSRLVALYESDALKTTEEIEYIDLRFGTKAFVKYLDDDEPAVDERGAGETESVL